MGHRNGNSSEYLNSFSKEVHKVALFFIVFVVQEMQLVESWPGHLPMVLLVHVAKCHGIGEELIKVFRAGFSFGEPDRKLSDCSIWLRFFLVPTCQRSHAIEHI